MNQIAKTQDSPVARLKGQIDRMAPEFAAVLPTGLRVEEFSRVVLTAVQDNGDLLAADQSSFFKACLECARDGLVPDGKEAYFDIRSTKVKRRGGDDEWVKKVVYMPMIGGFLKRAIGKSLRDWRGGVVRKGDEFELVMGDHESFVHRPNIFGDSEGEIIGAYSIAVLLDGTISRDFMSRAEIDRSRAKSTSGNGPGWRDFFDRMTIKTVMKRHARRLPLGVDAEELVRKDMDLVPFADQAPQIEAPRRGRPPKERLEQLGNGHDQQALPAPEREQPKHVERRREEDRQWEDHSPNDRQPSAAPSTAQSADTGTTSSEAPRTQKESEPQSSAPVKRGPGRPRSEETARRHHPKPEQRQTEPDERQSRMEGTEDQDAEQDPVQMAFLQGQTAYEAGLGRKDAPRELRAPARFAELDSWYEGWDDAAAESAGGRVMA